jgi:histidinol dehydrogenase
MMITTFEVSKQEDISEVLGSLRGATAIPAGVVAAVQGIIDSVRERGDAALLELTEKFDGALPEAGRLEVTDAERREALASLDRPTREALAKAESRISQFARMSLAPEWEAELDTGLKVGQLQRPIPSAGIYVPGGRFAYPSTVLMTGVLAREAGVGEVAFCIPPAGNGSVHPSTLAATGLVGKCRVFRVGGAQAIAAMALGTETVPAVRMIAGPGNVYVTAAKRLLASVVSIDLEAGPSEVAVYADASADLSFAAADLLAQLEHDPVSLAVLVSESPEILETAAGVLAGISSEGGITDESEGSVNLVRCGSRRLAIDFLNALAPEHLELMIERTDQVVPAITSAGCLFVGPYSAVALGDYVAGPSHVLPTGGTAASRSGLSAQSFRKTMNTIRYSRQAFDADAEEAALLARLEGLERHALSVDIRRR